MIRNFKVLLFAGLLAFVAGPVLAMQCEDVELPDIVELGDQTLMLNGMGVYKSKLKKRYVAGLYLASRTSDAPAIVSNDQPRRFVMTFLRDVSLVDVYDGWEKAIDNHESFELAAVQDRMDQLKAAMIDFKLGQTLGFNYLPGVGTDVVVNGESKTVIEGADFASALISVWLGPEPPSKKLKEGLLGESC